jgi:hypothetical protein
MRRLIGLSALLAVLGAFAISASGASASEAQVQECTAFGWMCAWSGNEWGGQFSHWPASSTGCHTHAENPNLRSFWNKTPFNVRLGGATILGPGLGLQTPINSPVTGQLCWPA